MPGLYANVVGGIVIVALVLVGLWLTWISLRSAQHRPAALERADPDDGE